MSKWPASSQDKALLAVALLLILFVLNTWVAGNEAGARIYRTDPCGTLTAISDGQAVQVECYYVSLPLVMRAAGDSAPMLTPTPTLTRTPTPTPTETRTPTPTPTPPVMCTPPPCRTGEVYYCPGTCPGGCGTQCATVTPTPTPTPTETSTPTPTPTPPIMCTPPPCGTGEVYYCPGACPGGCGTQCATVTPLPCMASGC
jgi:hypothetical protein